MILWLLRIFCQFRDLESLTVMQARQVEESDAARSSLASDLENMRAENQELITEKMLLQDRLEAGMRDRDQLWSTMQEALNNERAALRMQVNHAVQKAGGGIPYPDAHSLPPSVTQTQRPGPIGRSARMLPSELAARNTHRFMEEYVESLDPKKTAGVA